MDDSFVYDAGILDDGTAVTMWFSINASEILGHAPIYMADWDWVGVSAGMEMGIWHHPFAGLNTGYDEHGWIARWEYEYKSYFDVTSVLTEGTLVCDRL